jgi:hypothetical protein
VRSAALLGSSTFKFVVRYLTESYTNNILATRFDDAQEREKNFHLHSALQDLVDQLSQYASAADRIVEERQADEDEGLLRDDE